MEFVERELMSENGAFYSALDADSDGEEGKFYVWNENELSLHIGDDFEIFKDYYNINKRGFWENGSYILLKNKNKDQISKKHNIGNWLSSYQTFSLVFTEYCKFIIANLRIKFFST